MFVEGALCLGLSSQFWVSEARKACSLSRASYHLFWRNSRTKANMFVEGALCLGLSSQFWVSEARKACSLSRASYHLCWRNSRILEGAAKRSVLFS